MRKIIQVIPEGKYLNGFLKNKFKLNKNAIIAVTGPTGSGKSMACLRIAELWYEYRWKEKLPEQNICFSTNEVVNRLKDKVNPIRRGEVLILEEAGANLGSLDFQTKVSKLFTYILQSFRSMNVALIMNLPVLTMLNKQTRQLLHLHVTTLSIDFTKKMCKVDAKIHQLNQNSGKSYWKHPRVIYHGRTIKLQNMEYGLPAQNIRDNYEIKKKSFVGTLVEEYEHKTTKTPEDIRNEEKLKKEIEENKKREVVLASMRDKKGKLRCKTCTNLRVNVMKEKINCMACGHTLYFNTKI